MDYDFIYSPDDEDRYGKGWYIQQWPGQKVSKLFKTREDAKKALAKGNLKFS